MNWIVSPLLALSIVLVSLAVLCVRAPRSHSRELGWAEQVDLVRQGDRTTIHIADGVVNNDNLADLDSCPTLTELKLDRGFVTDTGTPFIAKLSKLEILWLRQCPLRDDGMRHIASAASLRRLNLPQGRCSDVGLAELQRLPNLEYLRISSPRVTADGLCSLGKVQSLRWLHLIAMPVSGESLEAIAGLKNLESLYVDSTIIEPTALEKFFEQRPDVHVHIDQEHSDLDPQMHSHGGVPHRH